MCYEMVKINELNEMLSEQKISLRTLFLQPWKSFQEH